MKNIISCNKKEIIYDSLEFDKPNKIIISEYGNDMKFIDKATHSFIYDYDNISSETHITENIVYDEDNKSCVIKSKRNSNDLLLYEQYYSNDNPNIYYEKNFSIINNKEYLTTMKSQNMNLLNIHNDKIENSIVTTLNNRYNIDGDIIYSEKEVYDKSRNICIVNTKTKYRYDNKSRLYEVISDLYRIRISYHKNNVIDSVKRYDRHGILTKVVKYNNLGYMIFQSFISEDKNILKYKYEYELIKEDDKTTNTYIIKETDLIFRRYIGEFTELNDTNIKLPLNVLNNHMKIKKIIHLNEYDYFSYYEYKFNINNNLVFTKFDNINCPIYMNIFDSNDNLVEKRTNISTDDILIENISYESNSEYSDDYTLEQHVFNKYKYNHDYNITYDYDTKGRLICENKTEYSK